MFDPEDPMLQLESLEVGAVPVVAHFLELLDFEAIIPPSARVDTFFIWRLDGFAVAGMEAYRFGKEARPCANSAFPRTRSKPCARNV